jgi:hypothetical protein
MIGRSSAKNRVRWQFGVLAPRAWIDARGPVVDGIAGSAESWWNQTECLLEGRRDATVEVRVRFLHLETEADGSPDPFDRAVACECPATFGIGELVSGEGSIDLGQAGGSHRQPIRGRATVRAEPVDAAGPPHHAGPLYRLTIRVENTADLDAETSRPEALRHSLVSTHLLIGSTDATFLSIADPPDRASGAARGCNNVRAFPVLGGPPGHRGLVISAPIILGDHPQIAPESPGDLFDAGEIDEILSLRTLALTDEEKAEARATDRRAAEIIDRVEEMPPQTLSRLHGVIRSFARSHPDTDGGEAPGPTVVVAGLEVGPGTRVELRPRRRGTDAQDMFLAGRLATVCEVLSDVDGSRFLAVCLDDDPRVEMGAGPGRLVHFSPDEIVPAP